MFHVTSYQRIMFIVPSTLQLLLASALVLLGVSGNLAIPFISYRSTLRCPHITVLAVLDFTATLLGPGLSLVTLVTDPVWWEHNKTLCQSLNLLSSWVHITSLLVLFFLAVFCQKIQLQFPFTRKRQAKRRVVVFLAMNLSMGFLFSLPPIVGWSSYNGLPQSHSHILFNYDQTPSNYSILYLGCSFALHSVTIFLAIKALRHRRWYPVLLLWERHICEMKINDPEMTTATSSRSSQSRGTSRSNRSYWSRRSSGRSGVTSVTATPLASRKSSYQSRLHQENLLLEVLLRQGNLDGKSLTTPGTGANGGTGKKMNVFAHPVNSLVKEAEWETRRPSNPRDPFAISSRISHKLPRKRVFQNPRVILPPFTSLKQRQSLSRYLVLKSSVAMLSWLPTYFSVALQLTSVHSSQGLGPLLPWLIFFQSSLSSLVPLCDAGYRLVLFKSAYSILKACVITKKTQSIESDDVEFKLEGTRHVRLIHIRPLQIQTLESNSV